MLKRNQKLDGFESMAVVMVAFGVVLIGTILILSLPFGAQTQIASGFEILNFSQSWQEPAGVLIAGYDAVGEFYDRFYVAFTQIAVLPKQMIETPQVLAGGITEFSKTVAANYSVIAPKFLGQNYFGRVAGVSITK